MGTPYAAAFPRPVYSAALGSQHGWIVFGAGDVPHGAMSLQVRSSSGTIEYRYREDLWGASSDSVRIWESPLRIYWDDVAWDAYHHYFASFPRPDIRNAHQKTVWNTWGDFKSGDFALRETIDFGLQVEPEIVAFDYLWAESLGSIQPSQSRFPNFDDQVEYVRAQGKEIAVWQTVGWVDRPKELGLSEADLLRGPDGEPRKASWSFFPQDAQHYALDPSSSGTRQYLRERTRALIDSLTTASGPWRVRAGGPSSPRTTAPSTRAGTSRSSRSTRDA